MCCHFLSNPSVLVPSQPTPIPFYPILSSCIVSCSFPFRPVPLPFGHILAHVQCNWQDKHKHLNVTKVSMFLSLKLMSNLFGNTVKLEKIKQVSKKMDKYPTFFRKIDGFLWPVHKKAVYQQDVTKLASLLNFSI